MKRLKFRSSWEPTISADAVFKTNSKVIMNQYLPTPKEILTIMELLSGSLLYKWPSSIENLAMVCKLLNEVTLLYSDVLI